ncbi:MAG: phenylacetate--CoA ligase family protein [Planctomycetes bacterium]|nr:phenylacetate--CoA ligase family protein [Planctomycetota bacterium]
MRIYQKLVRNIFYPLVLRRSGDVDQLRWLREFERTQYLPADELRRLQFCRLSALLSHAHARCPFYRERFESVGLRPEDLRTLDDLHRFPVLEKSDLQQHGADMVARNWPRDDLIPNQTGGSTGTPISFFLSNDRRRSRAAATLRHNRWAGWDVGDRVAVLWGAPHDAPRRDWRARLRRTLLREPLWLDTANVTEASLAAFHERLMSHRPRVLQAYARSVLLFAQYLEQRGLRPHRPHSIVTSAEGLEPAERALVERVFGCPVFNRYGCREVSVIASECDAHQGLHVMAEGLLVEIVKGDEPAKPGEMGSILVTDLLNHAMPLIRYRIGDVGAWEEGSCPCGRALPRLRNVEGRVTDFLVGSDGRLVSGVFLATYVVAHRPSLGQVQIHQDRAGEILYRIRPGYDFAAAEDLAYLESTSRQYLGDAVVVRWEIVEELPCEPSGKFLFSRSTVAPAFLSVAPREGAAA